MNVIQTIDNYLTENKIIFTKHVPYKLLQLHCSERQDYYGFFRTLSIYCVSNNNRMIINSNMRHDYFESSEIIIKISKTDPGTTKSREHEIEFKGDNELVNGWYEQIKNKYYLPHVNLEVLPKK